MTNREAIHKLIGYRRFIEKMAMTIPGFIFDAEPFDLAISALEKQEWHNARKDPPKRPDGMWNTYCVYTRFDRYGIAKYYAHGKWDGYDEDGDQIGEYEIIAYCNFSKPFTEEEV